MADGAELDEKGGNYMVAFVFDTDVSGNHDEGLDFDKADLDEETGEGDIYVLVYNVTTVGNEDEALNDG